MESGFDIRTKDPLREKELSKLYGVKFGREEETFYLDNVKVKNCFCDKDALIKCKNCPRQLFVSEIVDKSWLKSKIKKEKKMNKEIEAEEKNDFDKEDQFNQVNSDSVDSDKTSKNIDTSKNDHDKDFTCPVFSSSKLTDTPRSSRSSNSSNVSSENSKSPSSFPKMKIRSGRSTLNPKIMIAAVHVSSKYEISFSSVIKVLF